MAKAAAAIAAQKAEDERFANEKKMEELNKQIAAEQAQLEAEAKVRAEAEIKRKSEEALAAQKVEEERLAKEKSSGFKVRSTSTTTNKKKKLSKAAKQFGGKKRVKF